STNWITVATNVFTGTLASRNISAPAASFISPANSTYAGSASGNVATSFLGIAGIHTIRVTASSTAQYAEADNSCILTLDKGQPTSHKALVLNGAPVINLSGCSIRSNTSLDCNGHDGNVTKSYAAGSATACGKPTSNAPIVPDTYAELAKNITTVCG